MVSSSEHFPEKWAPVFRRKCDHQKDSRAPFGARLECALQHVGQAAVQKLVDAFGVDVAVAVDAEHVLREVLRCLAPDLLPTRIAVEAGIVTGAVQGVIAICFCSPSNRCRSSGSRVPVARRLLLTTQ